MRSTSRQLIHTTILFAIAWLVVVAAKATTIYLADAGTGDGTGSTPSNRKSVQNFNSSVPALPGDIISLGGTITTPLEVSSSGTAGHPITIYWESGAKLSRSVGSLASCTAQNYIIFDGGVNGIIENTNNGSALGGQSAVSGIYASGSANLEVRNLTFRNLFITSGDANSLTNLPFSSNGALYMNGYGNNIYVHNCSFSNICWVIYLGGGAATNICICSNNFVNYDHAVASLGDHSSIVNIYNNHFGSTACWDSGTNNYYHHDGIHIFFGSGSTLSNVCIFNNLFDGDWGSNNTAQIFAEGDFTHANNNSMHDFRLYNNIFIAPTNYVLNDGFAGGIGSNWMWFNNTFVGAGKYNSSGVGLVGTNNEFVNNLISGVNTFVSIIITNGCILSNNIYANQAPGGNSAFYNALAGGAVRNLTSWQASLGADYNSILTQAMVVNSDGTISTNSLAVGAGASLTKYFTTDFLGNSRPEAANWTVGACQSANTNESSSIIASGLSPILVNNTNKAGYDITNGLILRYQFNDGSGGIARDSSGNGQTGALSYYANSAVWTNGIGSTGSIGFPSNDGMFDSYGSVTSPLDYTGDWTIALWVNNNSFPGYNNFAFNTVNTANHSGLQVGPTWGFCASGSSILGGSPAILNPQQWYFIAISKSVGTNYQLYLNGLASCAGVCPNVNISSLTIGSMGNGNLGMNGRIEDFRIYNRPLSNNEVAILNANGANYVPPFLLAPPRELHARSANP